MGWAMGISKGGFWTEPERMDKKILDETFLGLLEYNFRFTIITIIGFGHFQLLLQREGAKNFD